MRIPLLVGALAALAFPLAAQDTVGVRDGVRIGITYEPGDRPGLVVLPGVGIDSARAIMQRDLDYSDRFELIAVGPSSGATGGSVNYDLYRRLGADLAVELVPRSGGFTARLHDVRLGRVRNEGTVVLPDAHSGEYRMAVHRSADEVVRWATGTPGIAATRFLFGVGQRIYRIDSDGWGAVPVTGSGESALSPSWSPTGDRFAYSRLGDRSWPIIVARPEAGAPGATALAGADRGQNITPVFSPNGRTIAYARMDGEGTDVFKADIGAPCCAQRLTAGRFADNLSPAFGPDGNRVAFASTRSGPPQIYVMDADGTDQTLLVPFDYGVTGASTAPEWSPDGATVAFQRDVSRAPQIFLYEVVRRRVRQLTSAGRNEDPTWAPDGRHVAFVSDRTGRRQIWVVDTETGRVRQLSTPGAARLPAWSPRLGGAAGARNP
jgi:TolB protein